MKRYLLLAFLCFAALSCTQETTLSITPDVRDFQFGPEGGSFDVVIFTNGVWTATCADESIAFSPASGEYTTPMHVEVPENVEHFTKAVHIQLTSKTGDISRTAQVVISQDCYPFILCEEPVKEIDNKGGKVRFSVNSNEPWRLKKPVGEIAFGASPETGGPNRTEVTLDIPANTTGEDRTFTVTLVLQSDALVIQPLTVKQGA